MASEITNNPKISSIVHELSWHEGRRSAGLYGDSNRDSDLPEDTARVKANFERLGFDVNDPKVMAAIAAGAMVVLDFQRSSPSDFLKETSRPEGAPLERIRPDMQSTASAAGTILGLLHDSLSQHGLKV